MALGTFITPFALNADTIVVKWLSRKTLLCNHSVNIRNFRVTETANVGDIFVFSDYVVHNPKCFVDIKTF